MKLGTELLQRLALAAFAVAVVVFIAFNARPFDEDRHTRTSRNLSLLHDEDARLIDLVFQLRNGLLNDYDRLNSTLGLIRHYRHELEQGRDAVAGRGNADIDAAIAAVAKTAAEKEDLVERFKTRHALLKNSALYFPRAVTDIASNPEVPAEVRVQAEALLREVLQLNLGATQADYARVGRHLQRFGELSERHPVPLARMVSTVARHGANILQHGSATSELVQRIGAVPTQQAARDLEEGYYHASRRDLHRANVYRFVLVGVTSLLLVFAVAMFVRLQRNTVRLKATLAAQVHEIAEREKVERQLVTLARYDSLTGLPNRPFFLDRLAHAMARAKRGQHAMALMFLDLDRFKEINDTLGHAAGDRVLEAAAGRLSGSLRDADTVARLGGDEFTVIIENVADREQVTLVAQRIKQAFSTPLAAAEREVFVTPSIGIAVFPDDGNSVETLMQAADVAMYHAKEEGPNGHAFYAAGMNAQAAERMKIEGMLRRALERQEFVLHYQPQVDVRSGAITGVEALIRWNSRELGLVSPARFIPVAEQNGLIVPIGEWVLRTACAQARAWQLQGMPPLLMSVNVSPRQFRETDLADTVQRALADHGLAPRFLELEITEGMIMRRTERTLALLETLHQLGVRLSVDDFGTGYSSLAYLKRFPVQRLKIDQSFVREVATDADDAAIVTAIIGLAKSLKLEVIAEGVETLEQLQFLARHGCDEYQGYYFSKAVPAEELARLLAPRGEYAAMADAAAPLPVRDHALAS